MRVLLWITLPCWALAALLYVWPGLTRQGGWAPLEHALLAVGVLGVWALLVLGWMVAVLLRRGLNRATWPALVVLLLAGGAAGLLTWDRWREEAACRAAQDLPLAVVAVEPAGRDAAIAAEARQWRAPDPCLWGGLTHALETLPVAERPALLEALLVAGMPPDARLLYGTAIELGDAALSLRLVAARRAQDETPLPAYVLEAAFARARPCAADGPPERRALLTALLRAVPDATLPPGAARELACLGWEGPAGRL